LLAEKVPNYD